MLRKNPHLFMRHISDEDLVRCAHGEPPSQRAAGVDAHLEACWDCRARMESVQSAMTSFVRAHHAELEGQLPPAAGPRALLRARLVQLASEQPVEWWKRALQFGSSLAGVAVVGSLLIAIASGTLWLRHAGQRGLGSTTTLLDMETAPNPGLTPGATREVTISEVCSVPQEEVVRDVSVSLRQKVLHEYGIADARREDYEIDYLITPRLGGLRIFVIFGRNLTGIVCGTHT